MQKKVFNGKVKKHIKNLFHRKIYRHFEQNCKKNFFPIFFRIKKKLKKLFQQGITPFFFEKKSVNPFPNNSYRNLTERFYNLFFVNECRQLLNKSRLI